MKNPTSIMQRIGLRAPQRANKREREREDRMKEARRAIEADRTFGSEGQRLSLLRLTAIEHARRMPAPAGSGPVPPTPGASNWVPLGPQAIPNGQTYGGSRVLVSGRVTAIVVDPTNPDIIYLGSANGGVWKTTNGGQTWTPKSDHEASLAIGALAMDPTDHLVLYAGTGEGNLTYYKQFLSSVQDSYYGSGVLKSSDGGTTWTLRGTTDFTGESFFRIAVNPSPATTLFAATSSGVYRSTDGGVTWSQMKNGLPAISGSILGASDVAIDPTSPTTVYAAFWEDGIYKTTTAGVANPAWTKLGGGLPAGAGMGRIGLGTSASSPQTLYAAFGSNLYVTTNGGTTWTAVPVPAAFSVDEYGNNVAVDPTTPDIVYVSGYPDLWKASRNPATSVWTVTNVGLSIHPDNHAFAFHPTNHLGVYAGSDGGVYRSTDGGVTWSDAINRGLCLTQFEFVDQHPTSDAVVFGGTQDNGTEQFRNSLVFHHADDGDGGYVAVDQSQPTNVLHVYYNRSLARSIAGGGFGTWTSVATGLAGAPIFYPPFALDQTNQNNIAYGTDRINLDGAQGTGSPAWPTKVTLPGLGVGEMVTAVTYVTSTRIYAGTNLGKVYRLNQSGGTWTAAAIHAAPFPQRFIWDIETLPGDPNTVIVGVSGFGTAHVWRGVVPAMGAATWTSVSGSGAGQLPDIPVYALAIEPADANTMYIGTDIGVFRTINGGSSWAPFSSGLPNAPVFDLRLHAPARLLRLGTHGRGMWERMLDVPAMPDRDIFVRDNGMDTGRFTPSPSDVAAAFADPLHAVALGDHLWWWQCVDIKIDALEGGVPAYQMNVADVDFVAFDAKLAHRNPQRGNVNRVYVQVHNRGIQPAANVTVKILYADASLGLPDLPSDFWSAFPGDSVDTSVWHPVGVAQTVPSLPATQPAILEWNWTPPMSAADHSCMLVVVTSPDDPIPTANQGLVVGTLVLHEKRAGLKNLHVVNIPPARIMPSRLRLAGDSKLRHGIRVLPSAASGWGLGLVFQAPAQKDLKLAGVTRTKPTAKMIEALKASLGPAVSKLDLANLYRLKDPSRGGTLEGLRMVHGVLQAAVLWQSPSKQNHDATVTLIQTADQKVVGGSTYLLRTSKPSK